MSPDSNNRAWSETLLVFRQYSGAGGHHTPPAVARKAEKHGTPSYTVILLILQYIVELLKPR